MLNYIAHPWFLLTFCRQLYTKFSFCYQFANWSYMQTLSAKHELIADAGIGFDQFLNEFDANLTISCYQFAY